MTRGKKLNRNACNSNNKKKTRKQINQNVKWEMKRIPFIAEGRFVGRFIEEKTEQKQTKKTRYYIRRLSLNQTN